MLADILLNSRFTEQPFRFACSQIEFLHPTGWRLHSDAAFLCEADGKSSARIVQWRRILPVKLEP
jgi:hypothetical protein